MKTPRDIISKMYTNAANLKHIAETGTINGSLLIDIEKAILEYHDQFEQFHPTPTEAEINEAAILFSEQHPNADRWDTFISAIQWLQNYQTQGRDKISQKEALSKAKDLAAQKHGYADWYQIDCLDVESFERDSIMVTLMDEVATFFNQLQNQASQPNPAIAVIEAERTKLLNTGAKSKTEEVRQFAQIHLLDKLLNQIKP